MRFTFFFLLVWLLLITPTFAEDDPLPSWAVCPAASGVHWDKTGQFDHQIAVTDSLTLSIFLSYNKFKGMDEDLQRFIFTHECGHATFKTDNEVVADAFAFYMGQSMHWLKKTTIDKVCKSLHAFPERCKILRERFKRDY